MVQDVKEFRTELQTLTFANGRALQQREIQGVIRRTNQCVPSGSSIETGQRIRKYAWVEVETRRADRCAGGNGAATDAGAAGRIVAVAGYQVGPIRRAASKCAYRQTVTRNPIRADTEGYPGLALDDAAHLPSADHFPHNARSPERKIVSVVQVEAVLEMVSGQAAVHFSVVRIRRPATGIAVEVGAEYCIGLADSLPEGVTGLYAQAAAQGLIDAGDERVIVGVSCRRRY